MLEDSVIALLEQLAKGTTWSEAVIGFLFDMRVLGIELWKRDQRVYAQGIAIGRDGPWDTQTITLSDAEYKVFTKERSESQWNEVRKFLSALDKIINDHESLKLAASHDPLTGALNRKGLEDWFAQRTKWSESELDLGFVVALLDLDYFKRLNDSKGHLVGDEALKSIAHSLKETLRSSDVVARLGGDEFVFVIDNIMCHPLVKNRLEEVVSRLPLEEYELGVTLGAVCYPKHGKELKQLIAGADKLLYQGKASGKNQIVVWEGEQQ